MLSHIYIDKFELSVKCSGFFFKLKYMCYVVNIPIKKTFVLYSLMLDVSIAPLTIVYVYIYSY